MVKQRLLVKWIALLALAFCALALPQVASAVDAPPSPGDEFAGWKTEALGLDFTAMDFSSSNNGWAIAHRTYSVYKIQSSLYRYDGERWRWTQTFNDLDLWDVSVVAPDDAWLLGNTRDDDGYDISHLYHYDGTTWQVMPVPADVSYGIEMLSAQEGYISGEKSLWRYDGNGWTAIADAPPNAWRTREDNNFQALDGQNLWISDVPTYIGSPWGELTSSVYQFDGAAWQPSLQGVGIDSLHIVSPTLGWAGGYQGAMWRYEGGIWQPFPPVPDPYTMDTSYSVDGVAGISGNPQEVWAVIPAGLYHYDGSAWRGLPQSLLTSSLLVMLAPDDGWMGPATRYNGAEWQSSLDLVEPVNFPWVDDSNPGVFLLDRNHAWYGSYVFDEAGWRTVPVTITDELLAQFVEDPAAYVRRTPQLAKIEMVDRSNGWAIGDIALEMAGLGNATLKGFLFRYDGAGWMALATPVSSLTSLGSYPPAIELDDLAVTGRDTVWVLGSDSAIHRYAGGQWQTVHPARVMESDEPYYKALDMLSTEEGWAAGNVFLHYAGGQWQVTQPLSNTVFALDMVSAQEGWAVGGRGVIYHYDGASWQQVPSPTTIDLNDVAAPATGVAWAIGYDWGNQNNPAAALLLQYDGSQWQTVSILPQMRLWSISMPDAENGLIAGSERLLLRLGEAGLWRFFLPHVAK